MQKILLVDDREDNLFSIETILEQDGYTFIKARSGREALKILLKEFDFALILMDVKMPNLNGFETASLIYEREKLRHIPIIFITANNYGEENIFKGYKAGAVDYIYKPINPDLLRAKVSVFIDLYKKNHALVASEKKLKLANEELEKEIEERKRSQEKVDELNRQLMLNIEQLKATNEELDNFAFIASHDLQEPLRKIRTFSDMLLTRYSSELSPPVVDYLEKIDKSSKRMQSLIEDILMFSRFSNNTDDFVEKDLDGILDQVITDLDLNIQSRKAEFKRNKLPLASIVPAMMHQLFQNLISNAIKFCKEGTEPRIEISSTSLKGKDIPGAPATLAENDFHGITIKDNGIGFDEQFCDMIFVIFKRLHNSQAFEGTGIGLAICRKIADKHNGYIFARSKPGEGSVFTLALPVKQQSPNGAKVSSALQAAGK